MKSRSLISLLLGECCFFGENFDSVEQMTRFTEWMGGTKKMRNIIGFFYWVWHVFPSHLCIIFTKGFPLLGRARQRNATLSLRPSRRTAPSSSEVRLSVISKLKQALFFCVFQASTKSTLGRDARSRPLRNTRRTSACSLECHWLPEASPKTLSSPKSLRREESNL